MWKINTPFHYCRIRTKNRRDIQIDGNTGYMLQKDSLLEWRSIYDNVLFGLEIGHKKTKGK